VSTGAFVGTMAPVTKESIRVGNLVRTSANDAGLVLQMLNGVLAVLDAHDTFERVSERDVGEKIIHRASTTDQMGRPITAKEMVKIVEGKHRGRSGIIEHVFQDRLFVRSEKYTKNRGYFAVGGSECRRDGECNNTGGGCVIKSSKGNPPMHVVSCSYQFHAFKRYMCVFVAYACRARWYGCWWWSGEKA
jgi:hypothetical protein